jgi:integrase
MGFHIFRRQATYYWRRRTPAVLANCLVRPHVFLSLKTTSRTTARRLAAQLDLVLEDAAMLADTADLHLSRSQIDAMLHAVVDAHLVKLERVALAAKSGPGFDLERSKCDDKRAFWAYTLLDAQGTTAVVRAEDRVRMAADGLSEVDIEAVIDHLAVLRINEMIPTKHHILKRMLQAVTAPPTAMNIDVAQGTYLRGMALALAETDRRYGGVRVEDRGLVDRIMLARTDPPKSPWPAEAPVVDRTPDAPPEARTSTVPQFVAFSDFMQFAESVIAQNAKDSHWDEKTQRQAKSISNLFVKFMVQDQRILDVNLLLQKHVGAFVDFLRHDIYVHYGKSVRDKRATIKELRVKGQSVAKEKRGIIADTLNRHLTFLDQIFEHATARGVKSLDSINLTKLRAKGRKRDAKRARNARPKLPIESARAIFRTPPFINCAGWDELDAPGEAGANQIFHCALYFVPILIYYLGARREELCGAMVDDIILDREGCRPYVYIAANEQRRIKNAQSERHLPLHPELIRLGFLDYVRAIKALGYRLLFPDLYSPSSRSPLGNRFYKQFRPILTSAGITEEGLGAHAVRHLFNAQLKKKLLREEDRADLMGHGGNSETSERYCEPHELDTLFEFIMKLPVITDHLEPRAINLIPWIVNKEVAPFSQPSRAKRSDG